MKDRNEADDEPVDSDATRAQSSGAAADTIGPYRVLQRIGEGGMGEVWLAEQLYPVRRQVALKVLKAGMDTAQTVARFEAERQALALMDHPAIAKVFDGGATPQGRPYFVMEYVRGEAEASFREAVAILDRTLDPTATPIVETLQELAAFLRARNRAAEAAALENRAARIRAPARN